jgi:hypothetical protein
MELTTRATERHFTIGEISQLWRLSDPVVRKLFEHEPGVLVYTHSLNRAQRRYRTILVPESVLNRVHARLTSRHTGM